MRAVLPSRSAAGTVSSAGMSSAVRRMRARPTPAPSRLRLLLTAWYRRNARRLPWRGTRDPYRIWVSEAMLQQTRVATAHAYYKAFLARFPTLQALARARPEEVLAAWSGLGYYRRARHLHAAARAVVARHRGRLEDAALEDAMLRFEVQRARELLGLPRVSLV